MNYTVNFFLQYYINVTQFLALQIYTTILVVTFTTFL